MKKNSLSAALLVVGLIALTACGPKKTDRVLNIYNWNDYIDAETIPQFEAETGIKVFYDQFDSNEIVEAKLLAGNSNYDIVVPSDTFVEKFIRDDLLQKLDKSKIPNLKNKDPLLYEKMASFDEGNEYSVGWMWGTTGIGYNEELIEKHLPGVATDSWNLLLNPVNAEKLSECGIGLLDDRLEVYGNAMMAIGKSPDKHLLENYEAAQNALLKISPYVKYFNSARIINDLANGDICIAMGFNGDILQANERAAASGNGVKIKYINPIEGSLLWFDMMVIPASAKNVTEAHEFINFFMRPEVTARISSHVYYANSNVASKEFLEEDFLNNPTIYPKDEQLKNMKLVKKSRDNDLLKSINRLWTELKKSSIN